MKNTIRARKNGRTASAARQIKTPAPKAAQQNVTIVVTDDATGEQANYEVQKPLHDAMIRDALAKGISLQQWFESAIRKEVDKPLTETTAPAHQVGNIDLMLVSEKQGTDVAGVNLSDEDFARLQRSAARQHLSLEQLLKLGFEQMANPLPSADQLMKLRELESSIEAATALMMVLGEKAQDKGLMTLTNNTILKLRIDFETAAAACGQPLPEISFTMLNGGAR